MPRIGVLLLLAAVSIAGQQTPPQQQPAQQQPPIFRTGAEVVRVDVNVLDRNGKPVLGLVAEDFVVEEDGVPQKIDAFQFLSLTGQAAATDDLTLTIRPRDNRPDEFAREDVRLVLILWDEYHIPPDPGGRMIRDHLVQFIRTMLGPTDLVGIMDVWTPMDDVSFSRDRYRLATHAGELRGRRGVFIPPRNVAEENHLRPGASPFVREEVAISALRSAVMHLGTLRESRKSVLYLGLDFGLGRNATNAAARDVIQEANAANVAVYSINPQGLRVTGSNFRTGLLATIAHSTGGESFVSNSPSVALGRAMTQASAAYLLGYTPTPLRHDGNFHKIDVKVRRSGVQVRSRAGYLAPSVAQKQAAARATAEGVLPTAVDRAFGQLTGLGRPDSDSRADVRTILSPDPPAAALAVQPPVVRVIRQPADLKAAQAGTLPPHAGRELSRSERILMTIALDGQHAAQAVLSIRLVDRRGRRLTDLPFTRTSDGWLLDLPLQSIARGDYLIEVEAAHHDTRATAFVPIRVK